MVIVTRGPGPARPIDVESLLANECVLDAAAVVCRAEVVVKEKKKRKRKRGIAIQWRAGRLGPHYLS